MFLKAHGRDDIVQKYEKITFYPCRFFDGIYYSGCTINIFASVIKIKIIFFLIKNIQISEIDSIVVKKNKVLVSMDKNLRYEFLFSHAEKLKSCIIAY